jgi:hypothetical protein
MAVQVSETPGAARSARRPAGTAGPASLGGTISRAAARKASPAASGGTAGAAGAGGKTSGAADVVRLSQRDIDGLLLCGEHYGAPYDLLAAALGLQPDRMAPVVARWRRAGYAATGRLGPGPAWCWLTRAGMAAAGLGFPATRPALARLAHIRAVLAARLSLACRPAWRDGRAWWHSERRLRAALPAAGRNGHVPDAEIHWPSIPGGRYAGQVWAVEVELTPKPIARTTRIMSGLLSPARYGLVLYLAAPAAMPVVTRAAAAFPPGQAARVAVGELPASAYAPEPPR